MTQQTISPHSIKNYFIGFVLSLFLTVSIFLFVMSIADGRLAVTNNFAIALVVGVALLQLFVQVIFFLHLGGKSSSQRWHTLAFAFMGLVVLIIVVGSLWIMGNLDYNMMHEHTVNERLKKEQNSGF